MRHRHLHLWCTVAVFMSTQGGESTKCYFFYSVYRPAPSHPLPHYQQPSVCHSVSVCAPAVCALTWLCRELYYCAGIIYFSSPMHRPGVEPSKNKWTTCFVDLRAVKSPLLALSLT